MLWQDLRRVLFFTLHIVLFARTDAAQACSMPSHSNRLGDSQLPCQGSLFFHILSLSHLRDDANEVFSKRNQDKAYSPVLKQLLYRTSQLGGACVMTACNGIFLF